jgi:erythromycin esterase-like protein
MSEKKMWFGLSVVHIKWSKKQLKELECGFAAVQREGAQAALVGQVFADGMQVILLSEKEAAKIQKATGARGVKRSSTGGQG